MSAAAIRAIQTTARKTWGTYLQQQDLRDVLRRKRRTLEDIREKRRELEKAVDRLEKRLESADARITALEP